MNRFLISLCSLSFLMAGCSVGDPIAYTAVALDFPTSQQQTNAVLSAKDAEIQDALRIITEVFLANGFARDQNPPSAQDQAQGIIATFGRYAVSIQGRRLMVSFVEFGKRRPSAIVTQTSMLMKDKLSKRFGAQRVSVETGAHSVGVR